MTLSIEPAVVRVVNYVAQHPGTKHSTCIEALGEDRTAQHRVRLALSVAQGRGLIQKTAEKPFRYSIIQKPVTN